MASHFRVAKLLNFSEIQSASCYVGKGPSDPASQLNSESWSAFPHAAESKVPLLRGDLLRESRFSRRRGERDLPRESRRSRCRFPRVRERDRDRPISSQQPPSLCY